MKKSKKMILGAIALSSIMATSQAKAESLGFDININFGGGLSSSQQLIFGQAEDFWESKIIGYSEDVFFKKTLTIAASSETKDGVGKILGSAGPNSGAYGSEGTLYVRAGSMVFDSEDIDSLENKGSLLSVIIHEMAHVIGFGTIWANDAIALAVPGSGKYTGQYALAAYRAEYDPSAEYVPVELDGGEGTADGHWDENWAGEQSDLMTGYIEGEITISNTTMQSFRDLGYLISSPSDVPAPLFGGIALLAFGLIKRKKSKV